MDGGQHGRSNATDSEIEGRGLLGWIGHGLRCAAEWVMEGLAELLFDWW